MSNKKQEVTMMLKFSVRNIGYDKNQIKKLLDDKKNDQAVKLCRVNGIITTETIKENQFGDYTKFGGSFFIKRESDNKIFQTSNAFFPRQLELDLIGSTANNTRSVTVDFYINVIKHDASALGYAFVIINNNSSADVDNVNDILLDNIINNKFGISVSINATASIDDNAVTSRSTELDVKREKI